LIRTHLRRCANRVNAPARTAEPDPAAVAPGASGTGDVSPARLVILAVTVIGAIAGNTGLATGAITAQEAPHD